MGGLEQRKDGTWYDPQHRQMKRHFRHMGMADALYDAYICGQEQSYFRKPRRNPYPPGKRHDEWERGLNTADPLGDYHGRNV